MTVLDPDAARRAHYAEFYGLAPLPAASAPVAVVHGNCQAEALRGVLVASTDEVTTVRIPPVHELEADDLPHLRRVLERTDVLVSQPVSAGYRDLPLGTDELASWAPRARVIRIPVVRYVGLQPYCAIIRKPWRGDPPGVPYHDLRTILAAARGLPAAERPHGTRSAAGFRAVAAASLDGLREREAAGGLVEVADLVEAAGADAMHTVNHPTNAVLVPLAGRIMAAAGLTGDAVDPGRTLLPSILAPIDADVLEAQGLPADRARAAWDVGGRIVEDDAIAATQVGWYGDRPEVVEAALRRYAPAVEALGL